jgi:hypothetical protein
MIIDEINVLLAKLKPSQYRQYWKMWNEKFRHRYDEIFGNRHRLYFPVDINYVPTEDLENDEPNTQSRITFLTWTIAQAWKKFGYTKLYFSTDSEYMAGYAYEVKLTPDDFPEGYRKMWLANGDLVKVTLKDVGSPGYRAIMYDKSYALFTKARDRELTPKDLNTRKVKIGKILDDLDKFVQNNNITDEKFLQMVQDSRKEFMSRQKGLKTGNYLICISRHPYDIAGMSTDRRWQSCMTLPGDKKKPEGGAWHEYVYFDITEGTLVAYLIDENDKNINHPYARIAIKPYYNYYDKSDVLLVPEPVIYSDRKNGLEPFSKAVKNWVEKIQGRKLGLFKFNKKLYRDNHDVEILKYDDEYVNELKKTIIADDRTIREIIQLFTWYTNAYVENAIVELRENPWTHRKMLYMVSGTWVDGFWREGTLLEDAVWKNGIWLDGNFHGTWEDGVWLGGSWIGKDWHNGEWAIGDIYSKKFDKTYKVIINPKQFKEYENKANKPEDLEHLIAFPGSDQVKEHFKNFEKYMNKDLETSYKQAGKPK